MGYRAYEYGARVPEWPVEGTEQLLGKGRYWNQLVELERAFRHRIDEAVEPHLAGETDEERQRARKAALSRDDVKDAIREADQDRKATWRQLRAASGLYWGNYLDVEAAYRKARQSRPRNLKFHRSRDEGSLTSWFLKGLPVADVWGSNNFLAIDPVPPEAWSSPVRATRRRLCRTTFRLRIATGEDRRPVHLTGTVYLHRPLPADGRIRKASLVRERIADSIRYRLILTVAVPESEPVHRETVGAVDVGWRKVPDGLRVAVACDQVGARHDLVLPNRLLGAFDQLRGLQTVRDKAFNDARASLAAWRDEQGEAPDWFSEATATMGQWRSPGRLAGLYRQWAGNRWAEDGEGFELLDHWYHRDRHLWQWQAHQRDQARAQRRDLYRRWAVELVRSVGRLGLERFDLRGVTGKDEIPEAARMRAIASVGELRSILEHTAGREGVPVLYVDGAYTTQRCHRCGQVDDFDPVKEIRHRCSHCGSEWDQDENAARNMIQGVLEGSVVQ